MFNIIIILTLNIVLRTRFILYFLIISLSAINFALSATNKQNVSSKSKPRTEVIAKDHKVKNTGLRRKYLIDAGMYKKRGFITRTTFTGGFTGSMSHAALQDPVLTKDDHEASYAYSISLGGFFEVGQGFVVRTRVSASDLYVAAVFSNEFLGDISSSGAFIYNFKFYGRIGALVDVKSEKTQVKNVYAYGNLGFGSMIFGSNVLM